MPRPPRRPRKLPSPQPARGGARPGAGRHPRATRPITVRLHDLTIECLQSRNRSADIERILLDALIASYTALRQTVPVYARRIPALKKLRAALSAENRS